MKMKNLNPIEQHVEKAVLGLAVIGAAWLAYSAMAPTVMDNSTLRPAEIEGTVSAALDKLQNKQDATNDLIKANKLHVAKTDYVAQYRGLMASPLPSYLVTGGLPWFGPIQIPAGRSAVSATQSDFEDKFAAVKVPEIADGMEVQYWQGAVETNLPPALPVSRDVRIVQAKIHFPLGQMRDDMEQAKNPLPPKYQILLIGRVEWERQERVTGGAWSNWKPAPPLSVTPKAASTAPKDMTPDELLEQLAIRFKDLPPGAGTRVQAGWALSVLMNNAKRIISPGLPAGYYERPAAATPMFPDPLAATTAAATVPATRPVPRLPLAPALGGALGEAGGIPDNGTFAPPPPMDLQPGRTPPPIPGSDQPGRTPPPPPNYGTPGALYPSVGATPEPALTVTGNTADYSAITTAESLDVSRYDDTIQPGHEYRYRARVWVYNPLYQWPSSMSGLLVDKDAAKEPWTKTKWTDPSKIISVEPADFFFVVQAGAGLIDSTLKVVTVDIFHWEHDKWFKARQNEIGVGGQIGLGLPAEFATNNTVVDILISNTGATTVVLLDSSGELIYRNVAEDSGSPKYKDLYKVAAIATVATRPVTTAPTTGRTPPTTGRTPPPIPVFPPPTTGRTPPPPPHY